jgi:hypothetical protein
MRSVRVSVVLNWLRKRWKGVKKGIGGVNRGQSPETG